MAFVGSSVMTSRSSFGPRFRGFLGAGVLALGMI